MKKSNQFHEQWQREEEIALPTERSFAHVMAAAFSIIAGIVWWNIGAVNHVVIGLFIAAAIFLLVGYTKPIWLRSLNKAWMGLGHLLFKVTNPIIMLLIYAITIMPIGLILKILGKDPLRRKRDDKAQSYWIIREPGPAPETMKRQF